MNIGMALLKAESIKLRRSFAFGIAIISPCLVLMIGLLIGLYSPDLTSKDWVRILFTAWAGLILPFFVALCASQLAGLEHRNHQWKYLDALPLPRWATFLAKQAMLNLVVLVSHVIFLGGALVSGLIIRFFHPGFSFGKPLLTLLVSGTVFCFGASLFLQAIQHWVAMRFSNIAISMGSALLGLVGILLMGGNATQGRYYPWSMPMQIVSELFSEIPKNSQPLLVLGISLAGFVVISLLGAQDAGRRELL